MLPPAPRATVAEWVAGVLAIIAVAGIVLLAVLQLPIPDDLTYVVIMGVSFFFGGQVGRSTSTNGKGG